jgi:prepilin-type N-terminal cleavage/methylation domain-containing protein
MRIRPSSTPPSRGKFHGFTLTEVLVSVAIVATMFVSLYAGVSQGFAIINTARENLRATQVMLEKMEVMRLYTWDQINSNGFIPSEFKETLVPATTAGASSSSSDGSAQISISSESTSTSSEGSGTVFHGAIKVTDPSSVHTNYSDRLKEVIIVITWTNGTVVRTREMRTFVGQNGLQQYIY